MYCYIAGRCFHFINKRTRSTAAIFMFVQRNGERKGCGEPRLFLSLKWMRFVRGGSSTSHIQMQPNIHMFCSRQIFSIVHHHQTLDVVWAAFKCRQQNHWPSSPHAVLSIHYIACVAKRIHGSCGRYNAHST